MCVFFSRVSPEMDPRKQKEGTTIEYTGDLKYDDHLDISTPLSSVCSHTRSFMSKVPSRLKSMAMRVPHDNTCFTSRIKNTLGIVSSSNQEELEMPKVTLARSASLDTPQVVVKRVSCPKLGSLYLPQSPSCSSNVYASPRRRISRIKSNGSNCAPVMTKGVDMEYMPRRPDCVSPEHGMEGYKQMKALGLMPPPNLRRQHSGRDIRRQHVKSPPMPILTKGDNQDREGDFEFSLWKKASKRQVPQDAVVFDHHVEEPLQDVMDKCGSVTPESCLKLQPSVSPKSIASRKKSNQEYEAGYYAPPFEWKRGELIGEGSFGKVYMGLNNSTGELFAVKQIDIPWDRSGKKKQFVLKLEEEIALMKELHHKHIVQYCGTDRRDDLFSIFMEYAPGGSIASMLSHFGILSEEVIRIYTRQIVLGVEYLHSKGIVHRDIKGANVLVSEQGIAKLADFGCSKQIRTVQTTSLEESLRAIRGSVPWMAPEGKNAFTFFLLTIMCSSH